MQRIIKPLSESELKLFHQFFIEVFDGQMHPLEVVHKCWHKYNKGVWGVFENGEIVAAMDVWPVKKNFVEEFKEGKRGELSLSENDLDNENKNNWFFGGIAIKIDTKPEALKELIADHITDWSMEVKNVLPVSIYCLGFSANGVRLFKAFDFKVIEKGSNLKDGMDLYRRDINDMNDLIAFSNTPYLK